MSQRAKFGIVAVTAILILTVAGFTYHYYYWYPYGWSHCCDKVMLSSLELYAKKHGGWFPRGEESPEASLSLLYRMNPAMAYNLRGKTVPEAVVNARLEAGLLLTPETCGWHYVEGLRTDDNPGLALFWDKAGLGHFGERLPSGGHFVGFVSGMINYIPGAEWDQFLGEQERLRAAIKR